MVSLAAALGVAAFAFSPPPVAPVGVPGSGLTRLTGSSPFPASCEARGAQRGSEVEPSIAAGPGVLIAVWQQDRYARAAAAGIGVAVSHDGGGSWQRASVPGVTDCSPLANHASDPWVSVGGDGTAYVAALVARADRHGTEGFRTRIAISASRDGAAWPAPVLLDAGGNGFNDKPSVTADPRRAGVAYAVWTLEGQAYLARTRDSGRSWSAPRLVERGPRHGGLLSSTIAVLGRRGLLHTFLAYGPGGFRLEASRSRDGGLSWSAPSLVARLVRRPAGPPVRAIPFSGPGAGVAGGAVYQAFVHGRGDIEVVRSADGGRSWSGARTAVRHSRGVFAPALAAGRDGDLALSYYSRGPGGTASFWIAQSSDGVAWRRRRLTPPFPLAAAPRSGHAAFLGDYSGLTATADGGFAAAFAVAPPVATGGGRSDVFVAAAGGG
jgi:hypothetical protein